MNNSDIISALSLALTAIIFLLQTDDSIIRLKIKNYEKWLLALVVLSIIILSNYQIFERTGFTFYFSLGRFYLLPKEWSLIIFLFLIAIILFRIFTPKIFNDDTKTIFNLLNRYRAEKRFPKLQSLLLQIMELKNFEKDYAEKLNDTIFNDHHLIEYFASNCPELLIKFTETYPNASINNGEHFYYILNGLFSDKSNQIFSEIRQYENETDKSTFLSGWDFCIDDFVFDKTKNYKTNLAIIGWLTDFLQSFPHHLKEDAAYFLNQYTNETQNNNNEETYSEEEIIKSLSRNELFNAIQLFRILLIEMSFVDKRTAFHIDRILLLLYSSWDFIQKTTKLETAKVQLDNDSFTVNEFLLKYLFDSYLSLYVLNNRIISQLSELDRKEEDTGWIFHQLCRKLDSLISSDVVSEKSKIYYITELIGFYFDMPDYFDNEILEKSGNSLLYEIKYSLTESPWGNSEIYRNLFIKSCNKIEFYRKNNSESIYRAKHFYEYLLPFTDGLEDKICDM